MGSKARSLDTETELQVLQQNSSTLKIVISGRGVTHTLAVVCLGLRGIREWRTEGCRLQARDPWQFTGATRRGLYKLLR